MKEDYNFGAFIHEGFECGLLYTLRYLEEAGMLELNADDIARLASHLESKKPWNTAQEWNDFILNNISKKYPIRKF